MLGKLNLHIINIKQFLQLQSLQQKSNFLYYFGLCHAVPQKWINILKGNVTEPLEERSEKDKKDKINSLADQQLNSLLRVNSLRLQLNEG